MSTSPIYQLTLHKTYYDHGFFNLGVAVDRFVRQDSGPISIFLGESQSQLLGKVNREANVNGTPRIMGGPELRNWFQSRFALLDSVDVLIIAPDKLWIKKGTT